MAVYKLENGKWQSRISYRDNLGKIITKNKRFNTKREAQNYETDFRRDNQKNIDNSIIYESIFESFKAKNRIKANESTIKEKEYLSKRFWGHLIHKKYVKISKKDWLEVYLNISNSDMSTSRKNKTITIMKSVCKFAYTYHDLPDHTKTLELLPKERKNNYDVWTQKEFNRFLKGVKMDDKKIFFETLFYTGARRDEIRKMRKIDLNYQNKIILIRDYENRSLKNQSSNRKVKVHGNLNKKLKSLLNIDGPYLFGGLTPFSENSIAWHFEQGIKRSGVKKIRLHDLRHSHATILISGGANIVAVSKRLGHANVTQTLDTYAHLVEQDEEKILEIIVNS